MEKNEFIQSAPEYYEAAIILYFLMSNSSQVRQSALEEYYHVYDHDNQEANSVFNIKPVYEIAIKNLVADNVLKSTKLKFGPAFIAPSEQFTRKVAEYRSKPASPLHVILNVDDSKQLMIETLVDIDFRYRTLKLKDSDFVESDDFWEPIPLDAENEKLQLTITKVQDVLDQVRSSNGYTAENEKEKNIVYLKLENFLAVLEKSKTTSKQYIEEYGILPLKMLIARFGDAIIGVAAVAAKEALKAYIKEKAKNWANFDFF